MSILDKYTPFVKDHAAFHDSRAREYATSSPTRSKRHRHTADTLQQLLQDISDVSAKLDAAPSEPSQTLGPKPLRLSLTEEDIVGLPPELLKELNLTDGDRTEFAILSILEEANGATSLDRLLIGLYRKTGEIHKRDKLTSRLYRMVQKNLIYNTPGKKGVYSLEPPAGAEPMQAALDDTLLK